MKALGEFRAFARLAAMPYSTTHAAAFLKPTRPAPSAAAPPDGAGDGAADDGLGALLAAIASEVHSRTAGASAALSAEFGARIAYARKTLPRDQAAAEIAALKLARKAALKFVRESAALEVKGRQKQARVSWRRREMRVLGGTSKPQGNDL